MEILQPVNLIVLGQQKLTIILIVVRKPALDLASLTVFLSIFTKPQHIWDKTIHPNYDFPWIYVLYIFIILNEKKKPNYLKGIGFPTPGNYEP